MIGVDKKIRGNSDANVENFSPLMLRPTRRLKTKGNPPTIIQALKAQEIKQGQSLHLECSVSADPPVEFSWTKNNIPIRESKNISFGSDESGRLSLSIGTCKADDSGIYMVTAKNFLGMAKISCQVLVVSLDKRDGRDAVFSKAAEFVKIPQDQTVRLNETAIILFELQIYVDTRIVWLFNQKPLKASPRFETYFDGSRAQLTIQNFQVEDCGIYSIIAISGDQTSTKDVLVVTEGSNLRREQFAHSAGVDKRGYDQLLTPFIERSLKPVESKIVRLQNTPPLFLKTISNINTTIGKDVTFLAQIRGYPSPEIKLTFHGVQITDRIMLDFDDQTGLVLLTLQNVNDKDFGLYTLTLVNDFGQVSCSARICKAVEEDVARPTSSTSIPILSSANIPADPSTIESGTDTSSFVGWKSFKHLETPSKSHETYEPELELDRDKPAILGCLRDISLIEGETITLSAILSSSTVPKLIWLKDDGPISSSNRAQILFNKVEGKATLTINGATMHDSGIYALVVQNQKGFITTHANVKVNQTPGVDDRAFVPADKFTSLEFYSRKASIEKSGVEDTSCVPNISKLVDIERSGGNAILDIEHLPRPNNELSFIEQLKECTVKEGDSFSVQAKFHAFPVPTCVWYHNDREIDLGSRYHTSYDPFLQTAILQVQSASRTDDGRYKLAVSNDAGTIESTSTVNVIPVAGIDMAGSRSEAAYISLEKQIPKVEYDSGIDSKSYSKDLAAINMIDADKLRQDLESPQEISVAPVILKSMPDFDVVEGQPLTLIVQLSGVPIPTVEWTRNSQILEASNRITMDYDLASKYAILYIKYIKPSDAGLYEVRASNQSGSTSCCSSIRVTSDKPIDNSCIINSITYEQFDKPKLCPYDVQAGVDCTYFVNPEKFQELETKPIQIVQTYENEVDYCPPEFIAPLTNQLNAKEGTTIQLIAVVSAVPIPEFTWTRNGNLLPTSTRIQQDYNLVSKLCCLTISGTTSGDSGTYELTASNPKGELRSTCKLFIEPTDNIDSSSMISPQVFDIIEQRSLKTPIEVIPGVDKSSMFNQQLYHALDKDKPAHVIKVHELEKVVPRILTPLTDISIDEGADVCLTCQVFGLPIPNITWFLNEKPINASHRIVIHYDILNKTAYLWIKQCKCPDAGQYQIEARNEVGSTMSKCELHVHADNRLIEDACFVSEDKFVDFERGKDDTAYQQLQPGIDDTSSLSQSTLERLEAPPILEKVRDEVHQVYMPIKIIKALVDTIVEEYASIVLEVTLIGQPIEEVHWLLNGQPIFESNDIVKEFNNFTNTASLKIRSANADIHSGTYEMIAKNDQESVKSQCQVVINRTPSVDDGTSRDLNNFNKLDVKIITRDYGESGVDNKPYTHSLMKLLELDNQAKMPTFEFADEQITPCFNRPPMLSKKDIYELDRITISVEVIGKPIPVFYWMKNGCSLMYSNRFAMNYNILDRTLYLYIQNVELSDTGVYYAVAENSAGSAVSGSIEVKVIPVDAVDKREIKPASLFAPLDEVKLIDRYLSEISGVDTTSNVQNSLGKILDFDKQKRKKDDVIPGVDVNSFKDVSLFTGLDVQRYSHEIIQKDIHQPRIPTFLSKMTGTDTIEGQNALISVMVDGWPTPTVQWHHSNKTLSSSNRISSTYDPYSKIVSLLIKAAKPSDSGTYTIKCSNELGEISDTTDINISKDILIDANVQISADGESRLARLESSKLLSFDYSSGIDTSNFVSVERLEELENSRAIPAVKYTSGVDQQGFVDVSQFAGLEKTIERPEFVDDESTNRVPSIIQPISDVDLQEGNLICLSAIIDAFPIPSFEIYKDGNLLESSNRICSFYDINSKLLYLRIYDCKLYDSGDYKIVALNKCGSSNTSCHVNVLSTESIDRTSTIPQALERINALDAKPQISKGYEELDDQSTYQAPVFCDERTSMEIFEGTHLSVPIQLKQAHPIPIFQWFKNNEPLRTANRFLHHYDMHNRVLLFKILHTTLDDIGHYVVQAKNKAGTGEFSLDINIKAVPSIDRLWQSDRYSKAVQDLDRQLNKPLPVTIVAPAVDYTSFVDDIQKFQALETDKPSHEVVVRDLKPPCKPEILQPLQSQHALETEDVVLQARTNRAHPICNVNWFKDNREIRVSNNIRPTYDPANGIVSLRIHKALLVDAGEYTMKISNTLGEAESSCKVVVNAVAAIDESSKMSSDTMLSLEKPKVAAPTLEKSELALQPLVSAEALGKLTEVELQMYQRSQPVHAEMEEHNISLRILQQPLDKIDCKEGDTVHIECVIVGKPLPQFMWYRNDMPLPDANRYTSHYNLFTNTAVLHIKYALAAVDCGKYYLQCNEIRGHTVRSNNCVLQVAPLASIIRHKLIASDEGIRNIEIMADQLAERKLLSYSKLTSGVDHRGFVDIDKFSQLEKQEMALVPIVSGVDASGNVPIERFIDLERAYPQRQFLAGIDNSSNVDADTLDNLCSFDKFKFVEVFEPLTREPRMKLVHPFQKETLSCVEGFPISLFCTIDAFPMPKVVWYNDGRIVSSAQRIISNYDPFSGAVTLHFMTTYLSDSGMYTLECSNVAGEIKQNIRLSVEMTTDVDETSYIRSSSNYRLLSGQLEFRGKENIESKDFLEFPTATVLGNVNKDVTIRYRPVGGTSAEVRWLLNGVEITEMLKIENSDDGGCYFKLKSLSTEQCGQYVCIIRNSFGQFKRSFDLVMSETSLLGKSQPHPPVIIQDLKSKIVYEGSETDLSVIFQVNQEDCAIDWVFNDLPIKFNDRVSYQSNQTSSKLIIKNTRKSDAGWYQCNIKSPGGTISTKAKIIVVASESQAMPNNQLSPLNLRTVDFNQPQTDARAKWIKPAQPKVDIDPAKFFYSQLRRGRDVKGSAQSLDKLTDDDIYSQENKQPARLKIRLPANVEFAEGHDCLLQTTVVPINDPDIQVKWLKDGNVIESGSHLSITFEMGYACLNIIKATSSDVGKYECVVSNKQGEDRASCLLNCQYTRPIHTASSLSAEGLKKLSNLDDQSSSKTSPTISDGLSSHTGKPTVAMALKDMEIKEGQPLKMIAKFTSKDKVHARWTLNDKPILNVSRFTITGDGGINILSIDRIRSIDNGVVCCTAKNKDGTAVTSCNLHVLPADKVPYIDLVLDSAIDMNLDAAEMAKMHDEFREKIMSNPSFSQAKADAINLVQQLVQDLRKKYQTLRLNKPKPQLQQEQPAPQFLIGLESTPLQIDETQCMALSVAYIPSNCAVKWSHNYAGLLDSQDVHIRTSPDGRSCLVIPYALSTDSGTYTATISNSLGSTSCNSEVIVKLASQAGKPSNKLIVIPEKQVASVGTTAIFTCRCRQKVTWTRADGDQLPKGRAFFKSVNQNTHYIGIRKVVKGDEGKYIVKIAGEDDTNAVPVWLEVSNQPKIKPCVTVPLANKIEVTEGSFIALSCQIQRVSSNEKCLWTKDGLPISGVMLFQESTGELHTLMVYDVRAENTGTYAAVMESSKLTSDCQVLVKPRPQGELESRIPIFIKTIKSVAILEGQSAKFEFYVNEKVNVQSVQWMRNNQKLNESCDYDIWYKNGHGVMFFKKCSAEDSGLYSVQITANKISQTCSATLNVKRA